MCGTKITTEINGILVADASITPNRPQWLDMEINYPSDDFHTSVVYTGISDSLHKQYLSNPNSWENSCAIRMSKALNYSGVKLASSDAKYGDKGQGNGVIKGKDGKFYWFRVKPLGKFLAEFLKEPDLTITLKKAKLGEEKQKMSDSDWKKIQSMKGIVQFDVSGWGNASGHFTLWDGKDLLYVGAAQEHNDYASEYYYFHMKYDTPNKRVVQTDKIKIWELK